MRWIPWNTQQALEPWMYRRDTRPRVCLTAGSRATRDGVDKGFGFLTSMVTTLAPLGYDLLVAAPEPVAEALRAEFPGIRAGWIPMDVVVGTLDLLVHHAGGATTMAALTSGVPQLLIPSGTFSVMGAQAVSDFGAGAMLAADEVGTEIVTKTCRVLLEESSYRTRAQALSAEIASLAPPAAVVGDVEALVR
jgi:UDP:flavonoid glycosyltransferase YjiC (YdhE family)